MRRVELVGQVDAAFRAEGLDEDAAVECVRGQGGSWGGGTSHPRVGISCRVVEDYLASLGVYPCEAGLLMRGGSIVSLGQVLCI